MEDKGLERMRKILFENASQRGKMQERLRELESMKKDLALDGSITYEELFERVLQLAKNKRILKIIDLALEAGPLFVAMITSFINIFLIQIALLIIYEMIMIIIRRRLNKKVSTEKTKSYYNIATIDLFDTDYTYLNNRLMVIRNKVLHEYSELSKLEAEIVRDNVSINTDESRENIIPAIENLPHHAQLTSMHHNPHQEKEMDLASQKPNDKIKSLGNYPQSKE